MRRLISSAVVLAGAGTRLSMLAAVGLIAIGTAASPALGDTYTLNLSAPSPAGLGQTTVIQATGANPPTDFFFSWLDVHAIPTSVLSACPAGYLNASQVASSTYAQGGEALATALREDVDAAGNFSMPVAYIPRTPGRFLICGYTNDGATTTLATSSLIVDVQGASGPAPIPGTAPSQPGGIAKPANVRKPRVTRSGRKLVCKPGSWSNDPGRYSYSWLVNGRRVRRASGRALAVTQKLRGRKVQCRVTASNAGGASTAFSRPLRIG